MTTATGQSPDGGRAEGETRTEGRVIGKYLILDEIASGGMATVHLAHVEGEESFVAVKCMHAHYARDPDFVSMFLDEAMLCTRIRHENVVRTIDVANEHDELLLVLELVEGESLSKLAKSLGARRARIPQAIVSAIVCDMLRGLHAAHEATNENGEPLLIVHRDVSPHNVLVGTDGVARVLDFGVAKARGRVQQTQKGQLKGKLAYMSPEQARGKVVDRRSDVFAAGIVLWELLSGQRLFDGENEAALLVALLSEKPATLSTKDPALAPLDGLVHKALETDPDARYATALDMVKAVESAIPPAPHSEVATWLKSEARAAINRRNDMIRRAKSRVSALRNAKGEQRANLPLMAPAAAAAPRPEPVAKGGTMPPPAQNAAAPAAPKSPPSKPGAAPRGAPRPLGGPALGLRPTPAPFAAVKPPSSLDEDSISHDSTDSSVIDVVRTSGTLDSKSSLDALTRPPSDAPPIGPLPRANPPPMRVPGVPTPPSGVPFAPEGQVPAMWDASTTSDDGVGTLALPLKQNPVAHLAGAFEARAPQPLDVRDATLPLYQPPAAFLQAAGIDTGAADAAPISQHGSPQFGPPPDAGAPVSSSPGGSFAQPSEGEGKEGIPSQITSVTLTSASIPPPLPPEHVRRLTVIGAISGAIGAVSAVAMIVILSKRPWADAPAAPVSVKAPTAPALTFPTTAGTATNPASSATGAPPSESAAATDASADTPASASAPKPVPPPPLPKPPPTYKPPTAKPTGSAPKPGGSSKPGSSAKPAGSAPKRK